MTRPVTFSVNGEARIVEIEARETLLDVVRHRLGLTGTHAGCEQGACGACTVLLDGASVRACLVLAVAVDGRAVTTIEGVGTPDALHPVQAALAAHHGLQCGFCTPGMVLTAIELLGRAGARHPADGPSTEAAPLGPDEVRAGLSGNLCRCTGYTGLVEAIVALAAGSPPVGDDGP